MEIYRDTWVGTFDLEVTLVFALGTYLDQWLVRLCRVGAHITNYTPPPLLLIVTGDSPCLPPTP